jgi:cell division septal protein FtsQ
MQSERQRTQRALQHARVLKFLATAIAVALLILVVIGAVIVLQKSPMFHHR